jgi:hypothetical protein
VSYYDILGVPRASPQEQIREAYERHIAALQSVLSANQTPPELRSHAQRARSEVEHAWEALGDPELRRQYDDKTGEVEEADVGIRVGRLRELRSGECRLCGSTPAIEATLSSQVAFVTAQHKSWMTGFFCRDCGSRLANDQTARTITRGWWGVHAIFNPWYIWMNLRARARFRQLPAPIPTYGVITPLAFPLPAGPPLLKRPGPLIALSVIALYLFVVVVNSLFGLF